MATDTPQGEAATTPGRTVFQGIVNGNSVTFYGIPVLAPAATWSRVYRITNVRLNANPLAPPPNSPATAVIASLSITSVFGGGSLLISNPTRNVGYVTNGVTTTASPSTSQDQCTSPVKAQVNLLSFAETFGTAFKTRVAATGNTLYTGQGTSVVQNVPGGIYNSESNFVMPVANGQTAGLSDYGTRLKAQFNNVPTGVRLFVSASNVQNSGLPVPAPAVAGGSAANIGTTGFAQLTASETGAFGAVTATGVAPGSSGTVPVVEIPVVERVGYRRMGSRQYQFR